MLRVDSGLPSEEHAVVVGAALARIAGRNPGAVGEQLRAAWRAAHVASRTLRGRRPGVPVSAADPFALGVHQAGGTARLPKYLRRPHDDRAAGIVQQARSGSSRIMALVGPAGSGRARTAWEAVRTLPDVWRIWRTDGDPAEELLAAEPYTVVWLTDATALLQPDVGPMLVDAVRARVDDPGRGPVLVVLLIWPEDWFQLTAWLLPGEPDPHAAARSLLRGNDVVVPDAFTASQVAEARTGRDAVLREAAGADQGQVAQALAGVLDLLRRYRHAPPDVRDVLDTAIDARRFGCPPRIPAALLRQVVDDRDTARDAIAYAVSAGLLIATDAPTGAAERTYRLAGALYHAAAAERAAVFPPARFWNALAAAVTDPVLLRAAAGPPPPPGPPPPAPQRKSKPEKKKKKRL
ncbi:hypothetical protein ABZS66_60005 [Dactylosporangium sp. NPDC005572]|uniref:hypothetical protein n=1 Tax=Dactylosporangium sp. NPDC005572 TaxID=3156889 RepID=UPI0033BB00FB